MIKRKKQIGHYHWLRYTANFMALFFIITLCTVTTLTYKTIEHTAAVMNEHLIQQGKEMILTLNQLLYYPVFLDDQEEVEKISNKFLSPGSLNYITIYDDNKKVVAEFSLFKFQLPDIPASGNPSGANHQYFYLPSGQRMLDFHTMMHSNAPNPLKDTAKKFYIRVGLSTAQVDEKINRDRLQQLFINIGIISLAFLLGYYFIFKTTRALKDAVESELNKKNQLLASIVDTSVEAIIGCDRAGVIQSWNLGAEKLYGYSAREALHKNLQSLLRPVRDVHFSLCIQKILQGEFVKNMEIQHLHKNGDVIQTLLSVSPLSDDEGITTGYSMVIHDITQIKITEERLNRTLEDLARSNRDLKHYAYVASHDLQEPLRKMANFAMLLEEEYMEKLDDEGRQYIQMIINSSRRMKSMINDILLYSNLSQEPSHMEEIQTLPLLKQVIDDFSEILVQKNAVVELHHIPDCRGNSIQLTQLFQNLISNGLKYNNSPQPRIIISGHAENSHVEFSVKDNGIGIDPEFHEAIFVIFRRLHAKTDYEGTGIGLAICKRIVESHQGKIWVVSQKNGGSDFKFTLSSEI